MPFGVFRKLPTFISSEAKLPTLPLLVRRVAVPPSKYLLIIVITKILPNGKFLLSDAKKQGFSRSSELHANKKTRQKTGGFFYW
jgi:hypothetical protein